MTRRRHRTFISTPSNPPLGRDIGTAVIKPVIRVRIMRPDPPSRSACDPGMVGTIAPDGYPDPAAGVGGRDRGSGCQIVVYIRGFSDRPDIPIKTGFWEGRIVSSPTASHYGCKAQRK